MPFSNVRADLHTRYIPIIGYPMAQSSASHVYNHLFEVIGVNAMMWPLELEKGRLHEFMAARGVFGIDKFTLTMPHKRDIIGLLDEVEPSARLFGSVNVVWTEDGRTHGASCDGLGAMAALEGAGVDLRDKRVLMLGAGSISGILGYEMARRGVAEIALVNRTLENARRVAAALSEHAGASTRAAEMNKGSLSALAEQADVLIQCAPLGMFGYGADYEDLDFLARLPAHAVVMEAIVNPPETRLVREAKRLGHLTVPGMDMLVGQMSAIFEKWFGAALSEDDQASGKAVLLKHLGARSEAADTPNAGPFSVMPR